MIMIVQCCETVTDCAVANGHVSVVDALLAMERDFCANELVTHDIYDHVSVWIVLD